MERAAWNRGGFLEPFQSVGITPPRGRQGHSVPTPRPLVGSKLVHVAGSLLHGDQTDVRRTCVCVVGVCIGESEISRAIAPCSHAP